MVLKSASTKAMGRWRSAWIDAISIRVGSTGDDYSWLGGQMKKGRIGCRALSVPMRPIIKPAPLGGEISLRCLRQLVAQVPPPFALQFQHLVFPATA